MNRALPILLITTYSIAWAEAGFSSTPWAELALRAEPAAQLNSQGLAQHDLSIRASGYSGAGLSINGLKLKSPYSAHYNTELPALSAFLSKPTPRFGMDNYAGHLVGTAAYSTTPRKAGIELNTAIGSKEKYQASLLGQTDHFGAVLGGTKAHEVDHPANDFEQMMLGGHVQHLLNEWHFDLLGGHQQKVFGAQTYYGMPNNTYAEERLHDTLLFAGATRGDPDDAFFRASLAGRHSEHELRIPSSAFERHVHSQFGAMRVEGRTLEIQHLVLNLSGDVEHERVTKDTGTHDRTRSAVSIVPQLNYERVQLKAGLHAVFQTDESAEWLPQAQIKWNSTDNCSVYASYSETVQQPDFQMLYGTDPFHTSNRALQHQKARKSELGVHQFFSAELDGRAALFHRQVEHAVDWVKLQETGAAWLATDLGTLDVTGMEAELNYYPSETLELSLFYQWAQKDEYDFYAGLYELDYPEHLFSFSGHWEINPKWTLFAHQILRAQTGHAHRESTDFGADASLGLHWFPPFANNARLSVQVDNLWGSDFEAIPGVRPRDLTASAGLAMTW